MKHVVLYLGHLYQPFWTIKIQPSRQQGPGKVKIWPRMPQNDKRGPRGHRIKQNKCDHCHWNVTAFAPLGSLPTPLHPSTGIANLICNAHIWALHVNITTWTYCSNWYFSHFILEIRIHFEINYFWKHYSARAQLSFSLPWVRLSGKYTDSITEMVISQ